MPQDLDVAQAPTLMRHIISEPLEPAGLNLWSQQASDAQGYNVPCNCCERCTLRTYQSEWVLCTGCTRRRSRRGLRGEINPPRVQTLDTHGRQWYQAVTLQQWPFKAHNPIQLFLRTTRTQTTKGLHFLSKNIITRRLFSRLSSARLPFVGDVLLPLMAVDYPFLPYDDAPCWFHLAVLGGVSEGTAGD